MRNTRETGPGMNSYKEMKKTYQRRRAEESEAKRMKKRMKSNPNQKDAAFDLKKNTILR